MGMHSFVRFDRRLRLRSVTAVSALALMLGLAACAGGPGAHPAGAGNTQTSATLLKVADETAQDGDAATAATLYRRVHELSPTDPVPLARLGATLLGMQDYPAAAQAYRAALALQPDNADLRRGLALALLAGSDPDAAMTELRAALAKRADDPRLYSLMGVAQDMVGRHDLAQQSYKHGLDLAPASVGLHNNYAMSLALAGNYPDAVAHFAEIAGPDAAPRYRLNLALAYGLAGDENQGRRDRACGARRGGGAEQPRLLCAAARHGRGPPHGGDPGRRTAWWHDRAGRCCHGPEADCRR